jgi:hypothetical protein
MTTIYHYTTWDKAQEILKSGIITGNLAHREQIRVFGNVTWFTANQYERTGYHMNGSEHKPKVRFEYDSDDIGAKRYASWKQLRNRGYKKTVFKCLEMGRAPEEYCNWYLVNGDVDIRKAKRVAILNKLEETA